MQRQIEESKAEAGQNGDGATEFVFGRFHWASLMPAVYTALLLFLSVLTPGGYFTISGLVFFILFIVHCFAYYGYRSK